MEKVVIHQKNWDGVLYPVSERKDKIVITISGSDGGLKLARNMAVYLQNRGIPALALGYFKTRNTEKTLSLIPLELIQNAINWLKGNGYQKIAIEGLSKGAEYALAAAIAFPEISCVIVKTPSWFYSEGLIKKQPSGTSCWSYKGQELPFTPYKKRKYNMLKLIWKAKEFNILEVNAGKSIREDSIIPIELIGAPILMFSTAVDNVWASKESCENLEARLKNNNFIYPYKHICFEYMSHMMLENYSSPEKIFIKSERKYPSECAKERKIMGDTCVDWIESVWN